MPTDTPPPERLARPPPSAPGCPFSSSGPVFLFAFFLSPKQHWDAFQRWHDTFFAPLPTFLPSTAERLYSGSGTALRTLTHALFSLSPDTTRASASSRALYRSHLSASNPGHGGGLAWFLFFSPPFFFYYCAASTIFFFISSSDCNCDGFSCAPLLRRGRRPASYFPPSARGAAGCCRSVIFTHLHDHIHRRRRSVVAVLSSRLKIF